MGGASKDKRAWSHARTELHGGIAELIQTHVVAYITNISTSIRAGIQRNKPEKQDSPGN